ncbi:MarR family transcriptional regulator for hemolysin [Paucimonas lemoignei]|uniref:MarR family transcriptional regulator for hemolysin n=1 Tax=Paucimonas lemoignei TaxID=29443 RepID=A0A4R3HYI2_PAULE|nr:MarR family transcriptional regulator [Paucimonas lemoignei]TCS36539.1 MarR family transcriptional regulator for hemolysin [Paucimonas lemoignei]
MKSRANEQFAFLLSRCSILWRTRVDERLRPWGMTHSSWRILRVLTVSGQRHHQTSLAKEIGVETPTLVGILDRMEKMQWVRREPDLHDRRVKNVEVTEEGVAICRQLEGEVEAVRKQMLVHLSREEVQTGIALLDKILRSGDHADGS